MRNFVAGVAVGVVAVAVHVGVVVAVVLQCFVMHLNIKSIFPTIVWYVHKKQLVVNLLIS